MTKEKNEVKVPHMTKKLLVKRFNEIELNRVRDCDNFPLSVRDFNIYAIHEQNVALMQYIATPRRQRL